MSLKILPGKYIVLGGSGLIGTSVLSLLKDVEGVSVNSTYFTRQPKIYGDNIKHHNIDLRDRDKCREIIKRGDYVILLASNILLYSMPNEEIFSGITSNLIINSQVLEASYIEGIKRLVWMSRSTVYPEKDDLLYEDNLFDKDPPDKYFAIGWTNRFIEKLCTIYSQMMNRKMKISILRPTCIYGKNEGFEFGKCHMLPAMVRRIVEKQNPIEVWGDGEQKRDLIHADDAARTCLIALNVVDTFESFNIGANKSYSVNEIIKIICDVIGCESPNIKYVDMPHKIEKERKFSFNKMKNILNFTPSIDINNGITELVEDCWRKYA